MESAVDFCNGDNVTCGIFEYEARLSEKYWWELYKSKNGGF